MYFPFLLTSMVNNSSSFGFPDVDPHQNPGSTPSGLMQIDVILGHGFRVASPEVNKI